MADPFKELQHFLKNKTNNVNIQGIDYEAILKVADDNGGEDWLLTPTSNNKANGNIEGNILLKSRDGILLHVIYY